MLLVLILLGLSVLICLALLAPLCLHCYRGPMTSISQTHTSEDTYIPPTQFRMNRPMQISTDMNYGHAPPNHLSPLSSLEVTQRRPCPSVTPTETESNNSYENEGPYVNGESDVDDREDPGYIEVLPEAAPLPVSLTNESRASTPSSDDQINDYVNVNHADDYLNVETPPQNPGDEGTASLVPEASPAVSYRRQVLGPVNPSSSDSDSDSSDEDYVNQPAKVDNQPGA